MKIMISILGVLITSNVFAQAASGPPNKTQTTDMVELVSLEKMPLPLPPGEADKMRKNTSVMAADGFSPLEKEPVMVKGFFNNMNAAKTKLVHQNSPNNQQNKAERSTPEVHKDLSTLKHGFKAASFSRGVLVVAAPSGTMINDAWTGIERFFQIDGVGSVRLHEVDLGATGGKFYMIKEAVNTRVHGKPAISKVFIGDDAQTIEEVVWVEGNKFYMLTFGPDLIPGTKTKAAPHITANFLAHELH